MNDDLFYFGISLLGAGLIALGFYTSYRIGKKHGQKEYYEYLTTNNQEDEIL